MALQTETFGLFTDANLTTSHSGNINLNHQTDESDNPQDTTIYFGSLGSGGNDTTDRKVEANSDPAVDNITVDIVDTLDTWQASSAYSLGDCVQGTTGAGVNNRFEVTTAGTSGSSEPTWVSGIGSTTTDNTVVWTLKSAVHQESEITLALTEAALATNTPGNSLSIGTSVTSGTANAVSIWIRVENDINTVSNNTSCPELALQFNKLIESDA